VSIKLYTIDNIMNNAVVDSATSQATGFPKENLIDNNLDTYWKPTSEANQTIDIDLQIAKIVDYAYVFVQNYTLHTVSSVFLLQYSDDAFSNNSNGMVAAQGMGNMLLSPHRTYEISETATAHRYWRITIASFAGTVPNISAIWLCKEYDVGQTAEYPYKDSDIFASKKIKTGGDRIFTTVQNKKSSKSLPRQFLISGTTNKDALRNAHQDCKGDAVPVVVQEGTTYDDIVVCKFKDDKFSKNEKAYQLYNPKITLNELPYIDSGDSY